MNHYQKKSPMRKAIEVTRRGKRSVEVFAFLFDCNGSRINLLLTEAKRRIEKESKRFKGLRLSVEAQAVLDGRMRGVDLSELRSLGLHKKCFDLIRLAESFGACDWKIHGESRVETHFEKESDADLFEERSIVWAGAQSSIVCPRPLMPVNLFLESQLLSIASEFAPPLVSLAFSYFPDELQGLLGE